MKKIAIYGAGGFGKEVLSLINNINEQNPEYSIIGFYDNLIAKGTIINGYTVKGGFSELNAVCEELLVAIAVGSPQIKCLITEQINNSHITYPTLIHPSVIIGDHNYVKIGKGCIICAGVVITTNIIINDFVTLNLSCTVGHDTTIGMFSSFMPTVNISGDVVIEKNVYVGTGAKIIDALRIGNNTIIGSGAVVVKSLPSNCTAVGVPSRIIKIHEHE